MAGRVRTAQVSGRGHTPAVEWGFLGFWDVHLEGLHLLPLLILACCCSIPPSRADSVSWVYLHSGSSARWKFRLSSRLFCIGISGRIKGTWLESDDGEALRQQRHYGLVLEFMS